MTTDEIINNDFCVMDTIVYNTTIMGRYGYANKIIG